MADSRIIAGHRASFPLGSTGHQMTSTRRIRERKILVAVDFGTTFSSIAWVHSRRPEAPEVVTWWGDDVLEGEDVPTILQYSAEDAPDHQVPRWGFGVDHADHSGRIYEWFKLALSPSRELSELARRYPLRNQNLNEQECERLITDYLRALKNSFDQLILNRSDIFANIPKEFIVTVPAIWSDRAKDATRSCAVKAGMGVRKSDIEIIKEPEAAGIYALDSMRGLDLSVGDTFVLCDAGGGTVDLISYTVMALHPPSLNEATQGTGGLCGATFINRGFERYLDEKFYDYPRFTQEIKSVLMESFEKQCKRTFVGCVNRSYSFPVRGLPDDRRVDISGGYLHIPGHQIERIFKDVTDQIAELVMAQMAATKKLVKSVLLAGGFGKSGYLRTELEQALQSSQRGLRVKTVKHSNTSIVRGALIRSLTRRDQNLPHARADGRIPTRSYGVPKWIDFDETKGHDPLKREWIENRRKHQIEVMHWFVVQGEILRESDRQLTPLCSRKFVWEGPFQPMDMAVYGHESRSGEKPPLYRSNDLPKIVDLKAKLDSIPQDSLERETIDGGEILHVANFDLETRLNSANTLTFRLIHAGRIYDEETVQTEFI